MPVELRKEQRAREEDYAYHIFMFFRRYSELSITDVERFGAELMKLAGFEMPPDSRDPTSTANDYKSNFRKWRDTYIAKYQKKIPIA
ncbi:hypothetical protein GO755_00290 [Spirosoma sp. HMF4905]|uniref:Uncharacterized protein n=1 Tax=Spirosoma arboris TaxID=2682092 RepID=A0A7K1S3Q7_9BACT|nr:hypothetical protein [Spirosoma arboris]MVM28449.1 hypothetical protein [Spirosoma arboris]